MKSGEIVVVRLSGGLSVARFAAMEASRVKLTLGRNKEAKIAADRVVFETGIEATQDAQVDQFKDECSEIANEIDVTEIWEVVRDEPESLDLEEFADLYWGSDADASRKAALLFYLNENNLHFVTEGGSYKPRTEDAVEEILARRRRDAEQAQASEELADCLSRGVLPEQITSYQQTILDHIRGYAVHGDNYTRGAVALRILEGINTGSRDMQRRGFDLLVNVGLLSPDEPLELERADIPEKFSDAALEEASNIDLEPVISQPHRKDLSALTTFTIDDVGTQDRDDALSLEIEPVDGDSEPTYRVGIHIADASALVASQSTIDIEADRRMATLYMPERKIPMVPSELSNDKGSLNPGELRVALSLMLRMSESGDVLVREIVPSVVRSDAALSYEEADRAISDASHPNHDVLASLELLSQALKKRREANGAINFDRPEMLVSVDSDGEISVRVVARATPSRQMVTEFMVLCNSLMAEFCNENDIPAAYRSQSTPDVSDLVELPEGPHRWYSMMRRMAPADLNTAPAHHGGLGVSAYTQATSPLRRYADMVMQRQVATFLASGEPFYSTEEVSSVAGRADVQVRELGRIEEDRRRYWFLKSLHSRSTSGGAEDDASLFGAVVLDNQQGRPGQLELVDYPYRVRVQLPSSAEPGDTVELRLHGVDLWRRLPQFVHER